MPIQTGTSTRGAASAPTQQPDWPALSATAKYLFADMVNAWVANSRVRSAWTDNTCYILGTAGELRKGALGGDCGPSAGVAGMRNVLAGVRGITPDVANAVAEEMFDAWAAWVAGFQVKLGPAVFPPTWLLAADAVGPDAVGM